VASSVQSWLPPMGLSIPKRSPVPCLWSPHAALYHGYVIRLDSTSPPPTHSSPQSLHDCTKCPAIALSTHLMAFKPGLVRSGPNKPRARYQTTQITAAKALVVDTDGDQTRSAIERVGGDVFASHLPRVESCFRIFSSTLFLCVAVESFLFASRVQTAPIMASHPAPPPLIANNGSCSRAYACGI
jgi:hypothetical protein